MASSNPYHDWLVERVYRHPQILDIDKSKVIGKAMEYGMFLGNREYVTPDLYFRFADSELYTELKSTANESVYRKGMSQLEKVLTWHEMQGLAEPYTRLLLVKGCEVYFYRLGGNYNQPDKRKSEEILGPADHWYGK